MDPGFRLDGRYRMERRAERHGPAQVRRARGEPLARRVAVTFAGVRRSRPDLRRRISDAARAAAALDLDDPGGAAGRAADVPALRRILAARPPGASVPTGTAGPSALLAEVPVHS